MIDIPIAEWSDGNFGALDFLMQLDGHNSAVFGLGSRTPPKIIIKKLIDCPSIRGTNIWVLYSDLCEKDFGIVAILCKSCPNDILEDACNRQDYSGQKLVESYLPVKEEKPQ